MCCNFCLNDLEKRKIGSNWYVDVPEAERWSHIGRANPRTQTQPLNQKHGLILQAKFMGPIIFGGYAIWYYMHNSEPIWLDQSLFEYVEKED